MYVSLRLIHNVLILLKPWNLRILRSFPRKDGRHKMSHKEGRFIWPREMFVRNIDNYY